MKLKAPRAVSWLLVAGCFLGLAGSPLVAADKPKPNYPFVWPLIEGFRGETLPFPLDFAPGLHFQGLEEIRFCPGFSKPVAPDYFSYSFVWWIDEADLGPPRERATRLKQALTTYFAGLMEEVGKSKHRSGSFPTTVEVLPGAHRNAEDPLFEASVRTWDAFFTGKALNLKMSVYQLTLPVPPAGGVPGRTVLYFEASPRLGEPDMQSLLTRVRHQLRPRGPG